MLERLSKLFRRPELPDATRELFRSARSTRELLEGLDRLIDRNRVALRAIEREIEALEETERAEIERIRSGELPPRKRRNALRAIQRVRREIGHLEDRMRIHDRNVGLHLELVGKIQAMEAIRMRGVDERHIDAIMTEFQGELEAYRTTLEAAEIAGEDGELGVLEDEAALEALEREILEGEAPARERPRAERAEAGEQETGAREAGAQEAARPEERHAGERTEKEAPRGEPQAPEPPPARARPEEAEEA